ncbi:MAG TPA: T9SS type A sorting domain-containing protein, partial [Prolixibacteraceae bacterium]|nr:T9SS type A sorting domain-containing protein [Prolixibacteraceae bacterium]
TSSFNIDKMVFSTNSSRNNVALNNLVFKAVTHHRQSEICIITENDMIEKVNIYNTNGTLINSHKNKNKLKSFNIHVPAKGIYFIEGINGQKRSVQKIVY